jgi:hypothetical protein
MLDEHKNNMANYVPKIKTSDLGLTSALLTLGCSLDTTTPYLKYQTDIGTTLTFFFQENDETKQLIEIWDNPELDREHPIALFRIFNTNRIGLIKEVKDAQGLVEVRKNGKIVLMSSNATEEQKAKLLSRL